MAHEIELHEIGIAPRAVTKVPAERAKAGFLVGRPSKYTDNGRVVPIPGCGRNAAWLGISRWHARITLCSDEKSVIVEPWAGARLAVEDVHNVVDKGNAVRTKSGTTLFCGPQRVRLVIH